jgi:hypothetical protein
MGVKLETVTKKKPEERAARLSYYGQNGHLVCLVNKKWEVDQSSSKEEFLDALRLMIGLDPSDDYGIFPKELRLSHEGRAALVGAVSTLLSIDQETLQSEIPYLPDGLQKAVKQQYGSEADSVEKFRAELIQKIRNPSNQR